MKWACLAFLIIDLLLIGFASFRYLTVPKSEVDEYKNNIVKNQAELNNIISAQEFEELMEADQQPGTNSGNSGASQSGEGDSSERPEEYDPDSNKNISMDEENIFEYDDQKTKQEGLDQSTEKIRNIFGD